MIISFYNYWYETMVEGELFMTIISSFFVIINYIIVPLTYDKRYLKLLMLNNITRKLFMIIIRSFFVMISYQILTLTYDQRDLRLLMLNNGTRKIIYDYYKLVFSNEKLHNDNIIQKDFKLQQWYWIKLCHKIWAL